MHQAGTVAALRSRLYQPDPPADAVGVYLDALRESLTAVPGPAPTASARGRGPRAALLAVALVVGAGALVAGTAAVPAGAPSSVAGATRERPAAGSGGVEAPPVTGVPIGSLRGVGRGAAGRFDAGGEHAAVSVNCTGEGTLVVRVGPDEPVTLVCEAHAVAFALMASRTALDRFSVAVVLDGPVCWSLSVGAIDLPGS